MDIIKMGALAIGMVLLANVFKYQKSEYAFFIQLACCVFIFFAMMFQLRDVITYISTFSSYVKIDNLYLVSILKMIGITYVAEFSSSICRDAGYGGVATQIQTFAKLSILVLSMPVLYTFLATIGDYL